MLNGKLKQLFASPALGDLWRWSASARLPLAVLCLLNAAEEGCSLGITLATRSLIDAATGRSLPALRRYGLGLLALAVAFCHKLLKRRTEARLLNRLRVQALSQVLQKQYAGLEGYHSGELVTRLQGDVNNVKAGIMEIVPKLVSMAVGFFGAAAILISMDWRFAFVLVAGGVLGAWLVAVLRSPMKRRQRSVRRMEGKLQSSLQETLQNLRLVKASGSERRMTDQLSRYQEQYYSVVMEQSLFTAKVNASLGLVFQFSWLFCMLWGGWSIYQGVLTYGSLAAIIRLVGEIQSPISEAADVAGRALVTVTSAERLKELLDLPDEEALTGAGGGEMYAGLEEIRLDNVTFSYGRESGNVLEQASAVIRPGDFAALTGISGGGKSTLFQLLLGIYRPEEGRVLFRFRGQEETASRRTRPLFAYVPQGNTLFSGTLRENFAMFTDNASDEEIMQAAETACVDRLVLELDEGLDTVIGERGVGLSEGQAQRVAVARALLSRAPILLLDESTSALDEETEARLLSNLSRLKQREGRGVTCLIVTHRRAALAICDYRLHVENAGIRRIDSSQEPAIAEQEEDGV